MEGGETDRCVIGTLNASTMNSGRLATYLGLAEDTGVDVLCVLETRMAPMGFQGATKAARLAGFSRVVHGRWDRRAGEPDSWTGYVLALAGEEGQIQS